ncbi:hypothetical protein FE360_02035 [Helicobacter pylori]|uniref:hypothetical protein n=1 Tax=Helicobacter pylori TaxID=210 RepID=UPI0013E394AF|nr:hypothetical protein [Helicobacter pylori]WQW94016.1 hypothetical protein FE360_02035 [Helicobacter pylori]
MQLDNDSEFAKKIFNPNRAFAKQAMFYYISILTLISPLGFIVLFPFLSVSIHTEREKYPSL